MAAERHLEIQQVVCWWWVTWRAKEAWSRGLAFGFVHVRLVPDALMPGYDGGLRHCPRMGYLRKVVYVGAERGNLILPTSSLTV